MDMQNLPGKPKKHRKWPWILLSAVILLVVLAAIVVWTGLKDGLAAYRLIRDCAEERELTLDLRVRGEGDRNFSVDARIDRTMLGERRVTVMEQYGVPLCYCDGYLYLENGKAYRVLNTERDRIGVLGPLAALCMAAELSVSENGDERIYRATVSDSGSRELMETLLLALSAEPVLPEDVTVELVARSGALVEVRFSARSTGNDANGDPVSAELTLRHGGQTAPALPEAVRTAILDGRAEPGTDLSGELTRLLSVWMELARRDPLEARLHLAADCGPLTLDERWMLYRTAAGSTEITCVQKDDHRLYFSGKTICDENGKAVSLPEGGMSRPAQLLGLVWQLCLNGELTCVREGEAFTYRLWLDEEAIRGVTAAILPEAEALAVTFRTGELRLMVTDGELAGIRIACSGDLELLFVHTAVSLSVDLEVTPSAETVDFAVPERVLRTLQG